MYNAVVAGMAFVQITMKDSELRAGLAKSQKKIESFASTAKRTLAELNLASTGAFTAFLGIIGPLNMAISAFTKFDDKIRVLKAISGGSASAIAGLEKYIRKQGATTAFTADQVADGTVELSRMGFEVNELQAAIRPAMDLVRATGEDTYRLGEVSDYAASALRIFNLRGDKFSDVCDVMGFAANRSSAGISDMGEALKIAGPSAAAINEDIRDTAAALMVMANAGIKGSLAGTSLRKIYQSIAAQSGKVKGLSAEEIQSGMRGSEVLQSMGIRIVDPKTGNLRKAADIMVDLARAVSKMKSGEKINFATDVFDLRGSLGALTMLSASGSQVKQFRAEMQNISGYVNTLAAEIEEGPGGKMRLLFSSLSDAVKSFGSVTFASISPTIDLFTDLAKGLSKVLVSGSPYVSVLSNISFHLLAVGAAVKGLFAIFAGAKSMFAPFLKITSFFDIYATGVKKAALEAEKKNVLLKHAAAVGEKELALSNARKNEADKKRISEEKKNALAAAKNTVDIEKRKLEELRKLQAEQAVANIHQKNIHSSLASERVSDSQFSAVQKELVAQEAAVERSAKKMATIRARYSSAQSEVDAVRATELAEMKKLEAVRKRFAAQEALNEKWRLQHTLSGSKKKFQELPEFTAAKNALQAQEKTVANFVAKRESIEKRRHLAELKNSMTEAEAVLASEQQKLNAVKTRFSQMEVIRKKHSALGVVGDFKNSPNLAATAKEIKAQEQVVRSAEAAVSKYTEELDAAIVKANQASESVSQANKNFISMSSAVFAAGKMRGFHVAALEKSLQAVNANTKGFGSLGKVILSTMTASTRYQVVLASSSVADLKKATSSGILALSLKGVSSAMLGVKAAFDIVLANPFTSLLVSITAVTTAMQLFEARALRLRDIKFGARMNNRDAQISLFENQNTKNEQSLLEFKRLEQLSKKSKTAGLTSDEMQEVEKLLASLEKYGSKDWGKLIKEKGLLNLNSDALKNLKKAMGESTEKNLKAMLSELVKEKNLLEKELSNPKLKENERNARAAEIARTSEYIDKIKEQLNALGEGKDFGLTGKNTKSLADSVREEAERVRLAAEEIKKAKDAIGKIESDNTAFRSSELDNQVSKIQKLREEYEKYMQVLMKDALRRGDKKELDALSSRLAQAKKDFAEQEADVRNRYNAEQKKKRGAVDEIIGQIAKDESRERREENFNEMLNKKGPLAAYNSVGSVLVKLENTLSDLSKKYKEAFDAAVSAKGERGKEISFAEQQKLDALLQRSQETSALYAEYKNRHNRAYDAFEKQADNVAQFGVGSWSVKNLQQMIGGSTWQTRTAKATEETAKNTKRMLRLKNGTTISYS